MKAIKDMITVNKKDSSRALSSYEGFSFDFGALSSELDNLRIFPGFCDVHVHFREPGFFYKESIETGSKASARGGYTAVCTMPNLNPVPDSLENITVQTDIIKNTSCIHVYPYGSITKGHIKLLHKLIGIGTAL